MLHVQIEKKYAGFTLRADIDAADETIALLGASGAGKTMTLKCIAGVVKPDSGCIVVDGQTWFDSERHINIRPQERGAGLMFQSYALFPNMTVRQNLLCGLRHDTPRPAREAEVRRLIDQFCLGGLEARLPSQLSGGQQQRVALARCLARKPRLLLLDEPFAALDTHLRWRLMQELRDTLAAFAGTALYVTHDREETLTLCHSVCMMRAGRTQPAVDVHAWYHTPRTQSAAHLAGFENVAEVSPPMQGMAAVPGLGTAWPCQAPSPAALAFRAADAYLADAQRDLAVRCRIIRITEHETVLAPLSDTGMLLRAPAGGHFAPGDMAWLCVPPEKVVWLMREEP